MSAPRGWDEHSSSNLALARGYVRQNAAYFSQTLYAFIPTPRPGLLALVGGPLAITDRLVLLYEPEWVANEDVLVLATGLAHECMHDQLRHAVRGQYYPNPQKFNLAADLFINSSMREQQRKVNKKSVDGHTSVTTEPLWKFPDWAAMPERYNLPTGLTADEYYALLKDDDVSNGLSKVTVFIPGSKSPGSGSGQGQPQDNQGEGGASGQAPAPKGVIMHGCCGGIAGNASSKELEGTTDAAKGRSEADCRIIAKETARAIKEYMESSQGRGNIPGSWSELIDISEEYFPVPWETLLANCVRDIVGAVRTGGLDYSKRRPSKRSLLRGITLPGLIAYDPDILFIIDSSGSMSHKMIGDALCVCADVLRQTGIAKARFMEADTGAQREPIEVTPLDLESIEIMGRGGTDFRPPLKYAEGLDPKPQIVIYATDGDGAAPATPPEDIHVIWAIVPNPYNKIPASWGTTIVLDDLERDVAGDEADIDFIDEDDDS